MHKEVVVKNYIKGQCFGGGGFLLAVYQFHLPIL